jgi:hypothetical protein
MDPITLTFGIVGIAVTTYYGVGYIRSKPTGTEATTGTETIAGAASELATDIAESNAAVQTGTDDCAGVGSSLDTADAFQTWYGNTNTFFQTEALKQQPNENDLKALVEKAQQIESYKKCVEQRANALRTSPTNLSNIQATEANLDKTIEQRRKDVQIAKDRAALAVNPELTRSYYDGWFPLDRPMKPISVPILIAFSLFFFSLGLFITMGLLGVNIMMFRRQLPTPTSGYGTGFGTPFWIMSAIAVTLLALTIYAFVKK